MHRHRMNGKQKTVVAIAAVLLSLMLLFPPWAFCTIKGEMEFIGYYLLFVGPQPDADRPWEDFRGASIWKRRWFYQVMATVLVAVALFEILKTRTPARDEE